MKQEFEQIILEKVKTGEWSLLWARIQTRVAKRLLRFLNNGSIAGIVIDHHGFRYIQHTHKSLV